MLKEINSKSQPTVVIMGRPNVGKSTLFNRLIGRKRALVNDTPGVTRDRIIEDVHWWLDGRDLKITLIDTGGLGGNVFAREIDEQVAIALSEASAGLFVFDGQSGWTAQDEEVLTRLRKAGVLDRIPVIGVVNKVDEDVHEDFIHDFYASALEPLITVSAEHGRGMDLIQEALYNILSEPQSQSEQSLIVDDNDAQKQELPRIAIVGKPNAGKSTLLNALLGKQRMITSPQAGTTVDSVDSVVHLDGTPYLFIDTAGIRKKSRTIQGVEVLSVVQARKALERADLALLMLDAESGPTDQDEKIAGLIEENGCSVILVLNKWDLQRKNPKFDRRRASEYIREQMSFLSYAPILFISAKEKRGLKTLGSLVQDILQQKQHKVPTRELSEWVRKEVGIHNPKNAKFFLCHQTGRNPPTFALHVNDPQKVHFSLRRHLVNSLRKRWGYMGSPVRMNFLKTHRTWKESRRQI